MEKEITAAGLRALIAGAEVPIPLYRLAAEVGLHPARLGQVLRGRAELTPDLARRVKEAVKGLTTTVGR